MLSRLVLRPRAAPGLAGHGPGRPPPRRLASAALAVDPGRSDWAARSEEERTPRASPRRSEMARRPDVESVAATSATSQQLAPVPPCLPRPPTLRPSQPRPASPSQQPRQKMPRGGSRPAPNVPGEPSRRVVEVFPRLRSGGNATLPERTPSVSQADGIADSAGQYNWALGYRGAASSDADARIQAVAARLERQYPDRPESHPPLAPTTTSTPTYTYTSTSTSPPTPPRLAPPLPSVIHALLPVASRASPAEALAHLEHNPRKLNPAAVAALDTWAYHTNDERTRQRLRLLARGEGVRIFPIDYGDRWNHASWKLERRGHRRPNKFLWQKYPPLDTLGGMSSRTLLRHQHALLLSGKGYALDEILGLLHVLEATSEHRLDALHLALAYASAMQVHSLLSSFATNPQAVTAPTPQRFSRQTVHLALLTRLRRRTRVADVLRILARFDGPPRRTPGPETWRHVAKHALAHDDADLARLAMDGGLSELGALRAAAARSPVPRPFQPISINADTDIQTRRRAEFEEGRATAADPPKPKFLHIGKHTTRWNFVLHACADRGWAVRGDVPEGESPVPRLLRRWNWLGEEGSFARRTDLVLESEVLAAAEEDARQMDEAAPLPRQPRTKSKDAKEPKEGVKDTTPANFGTGLGRRVVIDGVAYRVQKYEGRKVALTSWMRRRTRATMRGWQREKEKAAREAKAEREESAARTKRDEQWEDDWVDSEYADEHDYDDPAPAPCPVQKPASAPLPAYVLRRSADGSASPESMVLAAPAQLPPPRPRFAEVQKEKEESNADKKKFELPAYMRDTTTYMRDASANIMAEYQALKGGMNSGMRQRAMRLAKAAKVAARNAELAARKAASGKVSTKKSGIGKGAAKKKKKK
ncbi:hypothetical protein CC85DRAFT_289360 [Cutaneotrichosporon oleaginosum]|uniref:Uncharacterized protein n=1 Tax=Cutaneotrichosporon oleaginosum TaxID=879819 RepID=A0A0J0XC10_9TREE|nr:uncharacterized protein CC85DRAFT_289360 [Cutaneotrichosporon oleaginosum]KLT38613.1 hypothetical protein CC85DRAFT_289360 [Cutaneotrichosporon oleaginosum]TXT05812.1 hypothetical protein COLE_07132 [Cutaneotrichosporon oleaginosum]